METFDREPHEFDEAPGILQSAWRYKWMIVAAALLGALLGYGLEARRPTLYEGVSRFLLSTGGDALPGDASELRQEPERFLHNQAEVIGSWPVVELAARRAGVSPGSLNARMTVEVAQDSDVITVRVLNPTPQDAARLADAVGPAYSQFVINQSRSTAKETVKRIKARESELNRSLDQLAVALRAAPNDRSLQAEQRIVQEQLDETVKQRVANQNRVRVDPVAQVFEAAVPLHPAQPAPRRAAAAGLLFGLVASGALAWWLNSRRAAQQPEQARGEPGGQSSAVPGRGSGWDPGGVAAGLAQTLARERPVDLNEAAGKPPALVGGREASRAPWDGADSLSSLFARLDTTLRGEQIDWHLQNWPQVMAERVTTSVYADIGAVMCDNGDGSLEVAGDFGLIADERGAVVAQDHDVLRQALAEGVSIFQDSERLRAAAAGIPGSRTAEALVMVPLVQGQSWVGLLLVGRRSENGHGATAFNDDEIERIIRYAMEIAPTLQTLVLLYRLHWSLEALDRSRNDQAPGSW